MRIYDPRVGRFLSTDPLTQEFAFYSPYQFAGNTPIQAIDLDGLEPVAYSFSFNVGKFFDNALTGAGDWIDNTFAFGTKGTITKPLTTKTIGPVTTTSGSETKTTTEYSSNFGDIVRKLTNSSEPVPLDELPDLASSKKDTKIYGYNQVDVKGKKATVTTKTTVTDVEVKVEQSLTVKAKIKKVPVDVKGSVAVSTSGQREVKATVTQGSTGVKVGVSTGSKGVEVSAGVESKVGDTKVSTEVFIRVQKKDEDEGNK